MAWDREKERSAGKALGIGGNIGGIIFMVIWCSAAIGMGAGFMLVPGFLMLGFLIFRLAVLLKKAREEAKEAASWETTTPQSATPPSASGDFCPYCGEHLEDRFTFCPMCGRRR